ncbi:MAG: hypothetical protein R3F11_21105 [Verrucomicrobiales bacterium]
MNHRRPENARRNSPRHRATPPEAARVSLTYEEKELERIRRQRIAAGAVAAAIVSLIAGTTLWALTRRQGADLPPRIGSPHAISEPEPNPVPDEATDAVLGFLAADSLPEMELFVYDRDRVGPLMREYYIRPGSRFFNLRSEANLFPLGKSKDSRAYRFSFLDQARQPRTLSAIEERGVFHVDWEEAVGYCEIPAAKFFERRPAGSYLFRVTATLSDYFPEPFENEAKYLSLALGEADGNSMFFGFTPRASEIGSRFLGLLAGRSQVPVTIRVSIPDSPAAPSKSVQVDEFLCTGWSGAGLPEPEKIANE